MGFSLTKTIHLWVPPCPWKPPNMVNSRKLSSMIETLGVLDMIWPTTFRLLGGWERFLTKKTTKVLDINNIVIPTYRWNSQRISWWWLLFHLWLGITFLVARRRWGDGLSSISTTPSRVTTISKWRHAMPLDVWEYPRLTYLALSHIWGFHGISWDFHK